MRSIIPPALEAVIRARLGLPGAPNESTSPSQNEPSDIRGAYSHARQRRENSIDISLVMLSEAEIARTLLRYRFDRQFRGPKRIPIKTLAEYVGLSHETLFQAMREKISDRTRAKLSWVIVAIAEGRLRFRRRGQVWEIESSDPIKPANTFGTPL